MLKLGIDIAETTVAKYMIYYNGARTHLSYRNWES
jgi:hypothetical protein